MQKITLILVLSTVLAWAGCSSSNEFEEYDYQAVSALGDTLYAPELQADTESRYRSNLKAARGKYLANPDDADAVIWYGRRSAYLGNYRKAIDIFTEGIAKHPQDARMYRHRGHRYITIRHFDKAVRDLEKAAELIRGTEDQIEPDGIPNRQKQPRSTLHTNVWYHLGLAYYLQGNFRESATAFQNCLDISPNDDMEVASSYWLYMALRRAGYDMEAGEVLEPIKEEMNLLENRNYHRLLLVFKGVFKAESLLDKTGADAPDALQAATIGYGMGNWHFINGRTKSAVKEWRQAYQNGYWPAFGYIAAETDLKRFSDASN